MSLSRVKHLLFEAQRTQAQVEKKRKSFHFLYDDNDDDAQFQMAVQGDRELRELYRLLNSLDDNPSTTRSFQQKQVHDMFIAASIKNIYKHDFHSNYRRILDEYPQFNNDLNQNVILTLPRRFGKTTATAAFIAAYLLAISNAEIAVFSLTKRQSQLFSEAVTKFIHYFNGGSRVAISNQETTHLRGDSQFDIRKANYYPGRVESLRGVNGKTIVLEEAAILPTKVFYQVVLPLMQLEDAYLLALSTLQDDMNYLSQLMTLKDKVTGKLFFKTYIFYASCESCRAAGAGASFECNHNAHLRPQWTSSSKVKRIKTLFEGQEGLAAQELDGTMQVKNVRAFTEKSIHAFSVRIRMALPAFIKFVFVAIDPNGGGSSNFAIQSFYVQSGQMILLGSDAETSKTIEETYGKFHDHIRQLKSRSTILAASTMVFIIENNLAFESQHIATYIRKHMTNFIIMHTPGDSTRVGLHTSHAFKVGATELVRNRMNAEMMHVSQHWFTGESSLTKLCNELREFRKIVETPNGSFGRSKVTFTGKLGSANDDRVMALMLGTYWSDKFFLDPSYQQYH